MKIETRLRLSFGTILLMVIVVGIIGALAMRQSSAQLSGNLRRSFQITAATERLAALAHEHNVVVSMHAAAGTQPDAGRVERIEEETRIAIAQLARNVGEPAHLLWPKNRPPPHLRRTTKHS